MKVSDLPETGVADVQIPDGFIRLWWLSGFMSDCKFKYQRFIDPRFESHLGHLLYGTKMDPLCRYVQC